MTRKPIPEGTQNAVLTKSRRRCCLCYFLSDKKDVRQGQIAHLDQDHENFAEDNLAFLCLEHHDQYDSKTSQSKGFKESEVRHWRDKLYAEVAGATGTSADSPMIRLSMALTPKPITGIIIYLLVIVFQNRSDRPVFIKNFFLDLADSQRLIIRRDSIKGTPQLKQRVEPGDERSFNISREDFIQVGRPASDYISAGVEIAAGGAYTVGAEVVQRHVAELLSYKD